MIFDWFRSKKNPIGLKKALSLGLITKEEFLELEIKRAEKKLEKIREKGKRIRRR